MRLIKEAIYIRVNSPSLNKNIGKYHLPHIWDEVLNNITELKINYKDPVVILFATLAITSANHSTIPSYWPLHLPSGNNICHITHQWLFHLPPMANNISHQNNLCGNNINHITHQWYSISHQWQITSAIKIIQ